MIPNHIVKWGMSIGALLWVAACPVSPARAETIATSGDLSISGYVYIDYNNDGIRGDGVNADAEYVIADVTVNLTCYDSGGKAAWTKSVTTNNYGYYLFSSLPEGSYSLSQVQPIEFVDGLDSVGRFFDINGVDISASTTGDLGVAQNTPAGQNEISGIILPTDTYGEDYNFGELGLMPGYVSKRSFLVSVPEPSTLALLGFVGLAGLAVVWRRRTTAA